MTIKTKIIATIGPASSSRPVLKKMISAGMNVARLNFSHGSHKEHREVINTIRSLSEEMDIPVAIILDLQGPKIRTGTLKEGEAVLLKKNGTIRLTSKNISGSADMVSTTYPKLISDVKIGDKILIDDGLIELKVISRLKDAVACKIINGGILREHKGINLPGVKVSSPSLTEKDKKDLFFGIKAEVDYFALSFVRTSNDLQQIKSIIAEQNAEIPVIAKIEKPEAVENLSKILEITDAVMVARGDLGVEIKPELVPGIQKQIILETIRANKPVITATQMLETMTENPVPTRAEVSDVANAIYDGTDAVMLSGETARGKYPVEAVSMMTRIATQTESSSFMRYNLHFDKDPTDLVPHAVAQSAVNILHELDAKSIAAFSVSGKTSKLISKQRPSRPVYAFSPSRKIYNRLSLVWGITPLLIPSIHNEKDLISIGEEIIVSKKYAKRDDLIIIVTGLALTKGSTNMVKIRRIGGID